MKYLRFIRVGLVPMLAVLVLGASFISPALASTNTVRHESQTAQQAANSSLNAIIYLTTGSLASTFQSRISQQVPDAVNTAIVNMVSKLPGQDRAWAYEMATTLIQPSATLINLAPQQGGLAMTLLLRLYPGDPKAITASILISFRVLNSSTVQVSASPINGGPSLVNGPLSTFQIPIGSLNSIKSTPSCGNAALAMNLQFPVTLGQVQRVTSNTVSGQNALTANLSAATLDRPGVNSFIEIPAASLSSLSGSLGSMPAGGNFTAKNIRIIVRGSNIHILSDIYWYGLYIGTADTTAAPSAGGGNLVLHVLSTNLRLFGLFPFPMNNYNQQIQQSLNSKLGNAFAGKFYVAQAKIGPNSLLPCAAGDSLVLTGNMSALG
jgi:hypothetical protein